jgi:hypothetical protein
VADISPRRSKTAIIKTVPDDPDDAARKVVERAKRARNISTQIGQLRQPPEVDPIDETIPDPDPDADALDDADDLDGPGVATPVLDLPVIVVDHNAIPPHVMATRRRRREVDSAQAFGDELYLKIKAEAASVATMQKEIDRSQAPLFDLLRRIEKSHAEASKASVDRDTAQTAKINQLDMALATIRILPDEQIKTMNGRLKEIADERKGWRKYFLGLAVIILSGVFAAGAWINNVEHNVADLDSRSAQNRVLIDKLAEHGTQATTATELRDEWAKSIDHDIIDLKKSIIDLRDQLNQIKRRK